MVADPVVILHVHAEQLLFERRAEKPAGLVHHLVVEGCVLGQLRFLFFFVFDVLLFLLVLFLRLLLPLQQSVLLVCKRAALHFQNVALCQQFFVYLFYAFWQILC